VVPRYHILHHHINDLLLQRVRGNMAGLYLEFIASLGFHL